MDVMSLDGAYACSIVHGIRVRYTQGRVEKALEFPYDTQRGVFWAREGWICEAWIVVPLENRQDWDTRRMGLEEMAAKHCMDWIERVEDHGWGWLGGCVMCTWPSFLSSSIYFLVARIMLSFSLVLWGCHMV
jgi:hypothetical protein